MRLFYKHLLVAVVPALLVGLGTSAVFTYLTTRQILDTARRSAETESTLRARLVHDYFRERLAEVQAIAATPTVESGDAPEIVRYFEGEARRLGDTIEGIYFTDLEGTVQHPNGEPFRVHDRPYFPAMLRGEVVVTRVSKSRDTGHPVVLILVPARNREGRLLGSVAVAIPITNLLKEIEYLYPSRFGFAALVDDEGRIICVGNPDAEEALSPLVPTLRSQQSGRIHLEINGEEFDATFNHIELIRWTLVLAHSREEVLAAVSDIRRGSVVMIGVAFLLALLVASYSSRRLLEPMTQLVQVQRLFGEGQTTIRASGLPDDEVGDLGRSFNNMADEVTRRESESARAHESLRQQEQLLHGIVDNMTAAIYVKDVQGRYVLCNRTASESLGLTSEQIVGKTDADLLPDLAEQFHAADEKVFASGRPLEYDETLLFQGEERTFFTVKFPLFDPDGKPFALCGISTDITQRKRTEQALRESEARFSRAVRGSNDGIWDWNIVTDQLYCSTRLLELIGYDEVELKGTMASFRELLHPDDLPGAIHAVQSHLKHRTPYDYEHRLRTREGKYRWFRARGSAVWDDQGRPLQMAGSISDIHEQKRLEAELRQSQKMEAVGQLAGGIAHDFNNLLTVINGYCDLLLDEPGLSDLAKEFLGEISFAGRRASDLTQQLLAFSRKQLLVPEILNVNSVVQSSQKLLERTIGEHIQLYVDCAPDLCLVRVDPSQLSQVILNLVVNARDAMPHGGDLKIRTFGFRLEDPSKKPLPDMAPGDYVVLEVADNGTGIDQETLSRIFEPFFTTKEVGQGTGLGLATVYGIVRQLDGHIDVQSVQGKGTTFRIFLPAAGREIAHSSRNSEKSVDLHRRGRERILLVEDEQAVREFAERVLLNQGYHVESAGNGDEALHKCNNHQEFDLLVTDVVMPGMPGPELAERLHKRWPSLRILYLTGYVGNQFLPVTHLNRTSQCLQKPYSANQLAEAVRMMLDNA